jgi:hypothetical protein
MGRATVRYPQHGYRGKVFKFGVLNGFTIAVAKPESLHREMPTPQVLGHLAVLATLGAERVAWSVWDLIGGIAASRHWSPDYPCKDPVRLLARVCRVRTPLPRSGLPQAPERACECL